MSGVLTILRQRGAGFDPASLPFIARLDYGAADTFYQDDAETTPAADGDPVRVWKAAVGMDANSKFNSARPSRLDSAFGGAGGLAYTADVMNSNSTFSATSNQAITMMVVIAGSYAGGMMALLGLSSVANANAYQGVEIRRTSATNLNIYKGDGTAYDSGSVTIVDEPSVLTFLCTPSGVSVYQGTTLRGSVASTKGVNCTRYAVGSSLTTSTSSAYTGTLGSVWFVSGALAGDDLTGAIGFLENLHNL